MSYTNKQYTNPGWNNSAPPSLNQSNLNDISNAIQALNISAENRTTLGMNDTQDMQDVLVSLKNITSTMQSSLQEVQQNMVFLASGTYVGNNQSSITITFNQLSRKPKIIFIGEYINQNKQECYIGIGMNNFVAGLDIYITNSNTNDATYGGIYSASFTTSSVKMTRKSTYHCELNNSGVTYNYILLG